MKFVTKSEWFELDSPLGEPNLKWAATRTEKGKIVPNTYLIERTEDKDGKIVWFGQETNWVKNPGESWTVLSTNYEVMPDTNGVYPEGRTYFASCETPIYEKLYIKL